MSIEITDEFYMIDTIDAAPARLYAGGQFINDTSQRCPLCGVFIETTYPRQVKIALNHVGRRGFVEHLWNSHSLPLFRRDVLGLWHKAGFTGFETMPVRIVGWYNQSRKLLPQTIPVYRRVVATSH